MGFNFHNPFEMPINEVNGRNIAKTIISKTSQLLMDLEAAFYDQPHSTMCLDPEIIWNANEIISISYLTGQLIANASDSVAIRMSKTGKLGLIKVDISVIDDILTVQVEDNGMGIHPYIEPHLFKQNPIEFVPALYRSKLARKEIDSSLNLSGELGLGLSQINDALKVLDGSVSYLNKGKKIGAQFGYSCPLKSLLL